MKLGSFGRSSGLKSKFGLKKKVFRTFEVICLEKLKDIGIASAKSWAQAMGYKNANGIEKIIKRIKTTTPNRMRIYHNIKPRLYEAL